MATINLPPDFKELLKLLNSHQVEYLIIRHKDLDDLVNLP